MIAHSAPWRYPLSLPRAWGKLREKERFELRKDEISYERTRYHRSRQRPGHGAQPGRRLAHARAGARHDRARAFVAQPDRVGVRRAGGGRAGADAGDRAGGHAGHAHAFQRSIRSGGVGESARAGGVVADHPRYDARLRSGPDSDARHGRHSGDVPQAARRDAQCAPRDVVCGVGCSRRTGDGRSRARKRPG